MKKLSKKEAEEKIKEFFSNIKNKAPDEIKKIKRLSMKSGFKLKDLRKKFCNKCLFPYSDKEKIVIKNNIKSVECKRCSSINRWKIKPS